MTRPPAVKVIRNPGDGRPWAMLYSSDSLFEFRLFETRAEAHQAARALATEKLTSGADYTVAVAQLPGAVPDLMAIEAWIDAADGLLAATLKKGDR